MRILLLADIHGNWPALQALHEPHDVCLFLGDLVDYTLQPGPCIDWARTHVHHAVRGNHDHGVVQDVPVTGDSTYRYLTAQTRPLTRALLGPEHFRYLAALPVSRAVTLDDVRFLLVHATPRDPLEEFALPDPLLWQRRLENVEADVVCVGHSHLPFALEVGDKLVINPGSLGLPRDGDPRASYAVIDDFTVELKRLEYPVEETLAPVRQSALPDEAKDLLEQALRTGRPPARNGPRTGPPPSPDGP